MADLSIEPLFWWHHPESESYFQATETEMAKSIETGSPDAQLCNMIDETAVPDEYLKPAKLNEWYRALEAAKAAKLVIETEQELRKQVVALFFPAPEEGTNTIDLNQGWKLKLGYKIDRKIDEAALPAVMAKLREAGANADPVVVMKPNLDTKAYRTLYQINPEAGKMFDEALTIKPGSPTLELVAPKV